MDIWVDFYYVNPIKTIEKGTCTSPLMTREFKENKKGYEKKIRFNEIE